MVFLIEDLDRERIAAIIHTVVIVVIGLSVCLGAVVAAFFDLVT